MDSAGNAYVTGFTVVNRLSDYARCLPDESSRSGGGDAFVTKLNPTGSALVYSTYLGGSGNDDGYGIAVDSAGNAYVTGATGSTDFPTTPGAFQTTCNGGNYCAKYDAFVSKLNPTGSALVYSTYLGGNSYEYWCSASPWTARATLTSPVEPTPATFPPR